jgi:hypothetical protein
LAVSLCACYSCSLMGDSRSRSIGSAVTMLAAGVSCRFLRTRSIFPRTESGKADDTVAANKHVEGYEL